MTDSRRDDLGRWIRESCTRLTGDADDYDAVLELIGDARLALLGEATHGSHEFYRSRADISRRLITERGFSAVAVEADWPDAFRVNRYVRGESGDRSPEEALAGFKRFPTWMWRNTDVRDFIEWLRTYNAGLDPDSRAGFYGIDLYSLHASIEAVLAYLGKVDPPAAKRARERYACFDHFGEDTQAYGYATHLGITESCEREVLHQLIELRRRAADYASRDGRIAADDYFYAEQNARLVKEAEKYYRTMFSGHVASWNLRDEHMMATIDALLVHLDRPTRPARIAIWAHNSHLGDARATDMGRQGELNVGQLARERHGASACLIGFTTYTGTVTAASDWDAPAERKRVRPALEDSIENLFHQVKLRRFFLDLSKGGALATSLGERLERAIGVIYRPETERWSHYFHAALAAQFDGVIHLDETHAIEPLDHTEIWGAGEVPETFPTGI